MQDNGALIHGLVEKAMLDGGIYLQVIGAQTQGLQGQQPANMAGLKRADVLRFLMPVRRLPMMMWYCVHLNTQRA